MKKSILLFSILTVAILFSCSTDKLEESQSSLDPNFKVFDKVLDQQGREEVEANSSCFSVRLMAGQHHEAGEVIIDEVNGELTLTYVAFPGWTIDATHMSIGDCSEQSIPTTGSGNPKIGHFEHSSDHPNGTDMVSYSLNSEVLAFDFCFAAHAEVSGPTGGETAWAEGLDFDGNSWAMYVNGLLDGCTGDPGDGGGDDGPVQK